MKNFFIKAGASLTANALTIGATNYLSTYGLGTGAKDDVTKLATCSSKINWKSCS